MKLSFLSRIKKAADSRWFKILVDYLLITVGVILTAIALDAFLIPGRIASEE